MTTRRHLLWAVPLLLLLALLAAVLALPRFVASNAHRATIEALASSMSSSTDLPSAEIRITPCGPEAV